MCAWAENHLRKQSMPAAFNRIASRQVRHVWQKYIHNTQKGASIKFKMNMINDQWSMIMIIDHANPAQN